MKLSITARVFLAVLATAAFAVLAMGLAAHWSFNRGFVGYLNELAQRRMDAAVPRLAEAYRSQGDWEFLRDNRGAWFRLMRESLPEPPPDDDGPGAIVAPPHASDLTGAVQRFSLLDERGQRVLGYPE